MRQFKKYFLTIGLGAGLALGMSAAPDYHDWEHSDLRGLVAQSQSDLSRAAGLEHGKEQRERYHHAQDDLSSFDRGLSKGHFSKDHLDHAIEKLQSVVDHNTLDPETRDALRRDLDQLRSAREHYRH